MTERRLLHLVRDAAPPDGAVATTDTLVEIDRAASRFRRGDADVDSDGVIALLFDCDGAVVW